MGLLRKYFAWAIMGLVLVIELVAAFFVFGQQGAAKDARTRLETRRTRRAELRRLTQGPPSVEERIEIYNKRKNLVRGELGDCVLFLYDMGQTIEGLFDAKELEPYDAYPWVTPRNFDVFRVEYQSVYNREADKLDPLMLKLETDRGLLGLADHAGLAQAHVTIGDIFVEQKEFWVKKKLIEVLARFDVRLDQMAMGGGAAQTPHMPPGKAAAAATSLAAPIPLRLTVSCDYMKLDGLLEELLRSPLCIRIESIANIVRNKLPGVSAEHPLAALAGEKGGAPKAPAPGGAPEAPPHEKKDDEGIARVAPPRKYVAVTLVTEVPDIGLGLQEVLFPKATFADKATMVPWIDGQVRDLERRLKRLDAARPEGGGTKAGETRKPEQQAPWIARALQALEKAEPGKPVVVGDEMEAGTKREYTFDGLEAAKEWLSNRPDYERAKLEARLALWKQVRRVAARAADAPAGKVGVTATTDGFVVTLRPPEQFDAGQFFFVPCDSGVQAKLGLVTFRPVQSREGVKRAPITRR